MIKNISVVDLKKIVGTVNIIDIRSIEKFNSNHIPTSINIPKSTLITNYDKYLDKNETYYIYCQKGINSFNTCSYLNSLGYKAINVLGGYENWIISC